MNDTAAELRARLNAETGPLAWPELERHFARGVVVHVSPELDLVEVAARMVEDDRDALSAWLDTGQVTPASDEQAKDWQARSAEFWAVVAVPWVVIQEKSGA
ncbi:MAG TPA: DUF2288 domain-containing protein [Thioalkalivibrio sp.]|nr:DUF2288 domain-containing protein [Thioalkalivibrio sp.]